MILTEKWSIEEESHGFSLVEKREVEERKDGKKTGKMKDAETKYYYGTVYQALQAFLVKASQEEQDLYNIGLEINSILETLRMAHEEIKRTFRTEVLIVKGA